MLESWAVAFLRLPIYPLGWYEGVHAGYDSLCSEAMFLPISAIQDDVSIASIITIFILDTWKN